MASKIQDTDLFIVERSQTNYRSLATDLLELVDGIPPGTKVLFNSTSAPLYWSKVTTGALNNSHIRVVNNNGGVVQTTDTTDFTNVFKSISIPVAEHTHGNNEGNHNHGGSVSNHTHRMTDPGHSHVASRAGAGHKHTYNHNAPRDGGRNATIAGKTNGATNLDPVRSGPADGAAGGGAKAAATGISINNDTASGTSGNNTALNVSVTNTGTATSWNFAIRYNDCIICSKDPR